MRHLVTDLVTDFSNQFATSVTCFPLVVTKVTEVTDFQKENNPMHARALYGDSDSNLRLMVCMPFRREGVHAQIFSNSVTSVTGL